MRLWNVLDRTVTGRLALPDGFDRAELCDALERPVDGIADPAADGWPDRADPAYSGR